MKISTIKAFTFFALATASRLAWSWAGVVEGQIGSIDVAPGNEYGVRISLKSGAPFCGTGLNWAYLNESDSNYKVFVSALLAAKFAGTAVTFFSEKDAATGFCHIGYISVK